MDDEKYEFLADLFGDKLACVLEERWRTGYEMIGENRMRLPVSALVMQDFMDVDAGYVPIFKDPFIDSAFRSLSKIQGRLRDSNDPADRETFRKFRENPAQFRDFDFLRSPMTDALSDDSYDEFRGRLDAESHILEITLGTRGGRPCIRDIGIDGGGKPSRQKPKP